jgi:hypothetical protein
VIDKPIGGAIAGARVEILSGANRGQFVETDGNGVFQLGGVAAEQQIQIRAYKIGYFLDDRNVSISRTDVPGLEFTLERRRLTLTGTIGFSGGTTTADARVELVDGPDKGKVSNTDASHKYLLDRITWGSHTVRISSACIDSYETNVAIPNDSPWLGDTLTQNFTPSIKGATLSGTVTEYPRTQPSVGAVVILQTRDGRKLDSRTTDANGRYSFSRLCGSFYLVIQKPDFSQWNVPVDVFRDMQSDQVIREQTFRLSVQDVRYSAPGGIARVMTGPYAGLSCTTYQNSDRDDPPHCSMDFRGPATIRFTKNGYLPQEALVDMQFDRGISFVPVKAP